MCILIMIPNAKLLVVSMFCLIHFLLADQLGIGMLVTNISQAALTVFLEPYHPLFEYLNQRKIKLRNKFMCKTASAHSLNRNHA